MNPNSQVMVHSSTNPHNVMNATDVVVEESYTALDGCTLITNPLNHDDIHIVEVGEKINVGFVKTCDLYGDVRRILD